MSLASERRAAVERAFPGVTCKRVTYKCHQFSKDCEYGRQFPGGKRYDLTACVEAPADVLIGHGLIERTDIDSLPPSGRRYGLMRTSRGTVQASVNWYEHADAPTKARDMAAKLGIAYVEPESSRRREINGREVSWKTEGVLIRVDWDALRARVELGREARAS